MLNVLDLFSGIGGFSLGLERTGGFRTVAFCEVEPYCQRVLRHHWPDVPIYDDVRRLHAADLMERIDVVCGGFPCQDISAAGKGAGLGGARSGLWFEMFRIVDETRPAFVIIENVAVLRSRGLDVVLGCLASIGYDAEWHCIPAAAVGAPHRRDRVWIVAYPNDAGRRRGGLAAPDSSTGIEVGRSQGADRGLCDDVAYANGKPEREPRHAAEAVSDSRNARLVTGGCGDMLSIAGSAQAMAYANGCGLERWPNEHESRPGRIAAEPGNFGADVSDASSDGRRQGGSVGDGLHCEARCIRPGESAGIHTAFRDADRTGLAIGQSESGDARPKLTTIERADWWIVEPDVGRVANGIPARVDRLRSLGNSIVPQIAQQIGQAILHASA